MRIEHLVLQNFRCFESLEVRLNPQFNLLVGDNASGKTSLLDAIHIAAGSWLLGVDVPRRAPAIDDDEVRLRAIEQGKNRFTFERQYPVRIRASGTVMGHQATWVRERVSDRSTTRYSDAKAILDIGRGTVASLRSGDRVVLPLISAYGAERLWIEPDRVRGNGRAGSSWNSERPSRLLGYRNIEFLIHEEGLFDWLAKETFASLQEGSRSPALRVVTQAIVGCIDDAEDFYYDVRREDLVVTFKNHGTHPYSHLSDGQRVMLSVVGDIAKKAALLNPDLNEKMLEDTPGIVTIDELDLHLHPKWQRRVIQDLKRTFPNIQFVATTHSPQLIGEALPAEIRVLEDWNVSTPNRSFGLDSNRVLQEVMHASPRNEETRAQLSELSEAIDSENLVRAKELVSRVAAELGGGDPEVTGANTLIGLLESTQ
ncbi:MAG: AAA family ATPase [Terracidiphilus sp.]|jgi:predicted ATP-binding protein involved in virulence